MTFWKMAYDMGWATVEMVAAAVKTESNPFGEITPGEYKEITGFIYPKTK